MCFVGGLFGCSAGWLSGTAVSTDLQCGAELQDVES